VRKSKGKYGIIILAAGSSSRMGSPKQLLVYQGKSLIRHVADESVKAAGKNVIVVLGAESERIESQLKEAKVHTVLNTGWEKGMSSSIRAGLLALQAINDSLDGTILAVCDQPFVSSALFETLMSLKDSNDKGIIACAYGDTDGTPALFDKKYFEELERLKETEGAKKLLITYNEDLLTIPFPGGVTDIDTEQDYTSLMEFKQV
jgi:molybdenum cofactor cytidylyltransferase